MKTVEEIKTYLREKLRVREEMVEIHQGINKDDYDPCLGQVGEDLARINRIKINLLKELLGEIDKD